MKTSIRHLSSRRSPTRNKLTGFTIIEMVIVLGVIAILILAANVGLGLRTDAAGKGEAQSLEFASECARTGFMNRPNWNGVTIVQLVNSRCFAVELTTGLGTAQASAANKYGGAITAAAVNLYGTDDGLEITSTAIPSDVCAAMLPMLRRPSRITVTPAAGAATTILALGSTTQSVDAKLACGADTTVTIRAAITKG